MKINEQYHNLSLLENVTYEFLGRDGETHEETEPILVEHMMDVYVNERLTMKLVCIPEHLAELVLGRLFTEGIISSADDVDQIYICEFGKRARVILSKNKSGQPHEENEHYVAPTPTCCTGNHILNDYFVSGQTPKTVPSINWKPDWIFQMADAFADGMPLHSTTFATHSCLLARNGQTVSPMVPRFTARPGRPIAASLPAMENFSSSVKTSAVTMPWTNPLAMPCVMVLI